MEARKGCAGAVPFIERSDELFRRERDKDGPTDLPRRFKCCMARLECEMSWLILLLRGQKVILDSDLVRVYDAAISNRD